jgi:oligopeptide/dipeptide ABC transporter ATP-binding protein
MSEPALLDVRDLRVELRRSGGGRSVRIVDGVSLSVARGEALGIVGESGSGKTMTALAILGLLPPAARVTAGRAEFAGRDLLALSEAELRTIRGARISMIFQDPMVALDPLFTIGDQLTEAMRAHCTLPAGDMQRRARELLEAVGVAAPEVRLRQYPHEMSGGMLQRVVGAIAISCDAELVIADEPTTALDATLQAQFIDVLDGLKKQRGMSIVLVTHDFGTAARLCERIVVMYAGQIVENGPMRRIFRAPAHPYTRALLGAVAIGEPGHRRRLPTIAGQPPDLAELPPGCRFAERCPLVDERCRTTEPPVVDIDLEHSARCWKAGAV